MRQIEEMDLKIQNPETIEHKMYELLENMQYPESIIKTIIYKIHDETNQDYNFDMYFDYRDTIDESTIAEFINRYTLHDEPKCENLDEAKCDFECFVEEKYDLRESENTYRGDLASKLDDIELDKRDGLENVRCYVDGHEVVNRLYDELGILNVYYNVFDMCKGRYRIAISGKKQHDLFTTCFFDGKYKDEERLVDGTWKLLPTYWKEDIQETKDEYLIQGLCKANGFDIEDIFKYQMSEDGSKEEQKYTEFREKNKFFDDLYTELSNTFGYGEDLYFLTNMDIDELLTYACVKNQKYDLYNTSYFGFYDHVNGSGSTFDGSIDFHYEVDTKDLDIMLFSNVHYFEETYGFTNKVFGL